MLFLGGPSTVTFDDLAGIAAQDLTNRRCRSSNYGKATSNVAASTTRASAIPP